MNLKLKLKIAIIEIRIKIKKSFLFHRSLNTFSIHTQKLPRSLPTTMTISSTRSQTRPKLKTSTTGMTFSNRTSKSKRQSSRMRSRAILRSWWSRPRSCCPSFARSSSIEWSFGDTSTRTSHIEESINISQSECFKE